MIVRENMLVTCDCQDPFHANCIPEIEALGQVMKILQNILLWSSQTQTIDVNSKGIGKATMSLFKLFFHDLP